MKNKKINYEESFGQMCCGGEYELLIDIKTNNSYYFYDLRNRIYLRTHNLHLTAPRNSGFRLTAIDASCSVFGMMQIGLR